MNSKPDKVRSMFNELINGHNYYKPDILVHSFSSFLRNTKSSLRTNSYHVPIDNL